MRACCLLLLAPLAACSVTSSDTTSGDNGSSGSAASSSEQGASGSGPASSGTRSSSHMPALPQGTISGTVVAPSGNFGIFDALVELRFTSNGASVRRSTYTRFDGTFTLYNIPAGSYTLNATRGIYSGSGMASVPLEGDTVDGVEVRMLSSGVRFEVVSGSYDHIGDIVQGLGFTPTLISGTGNANWLTQVTDEDTLTNSHAILLNCGLHDSTLWDLADLETRRQALRDYVASGKSLYISDWAYNVFEWLFPEALTFYGDDAEHDSAKVGTVETVLASIPDETLRKLVGNSIHIKYDLSSWAIIQAVDAPAASMLTVDVMAQGTVHTTNGLAVDDVPLAVILHHGAGRVVYTTFHNEAQLDETVAAVLRYMIMSL